MTATTATPPPTAGTDLPAWSRLAALSAARRVALYNESMRLYDTIRARYRASLGTREEARCLRLLARAYDRELRRAPLTLR